MKNLLFGITLVFFVGCVLNEEDRDHSISQEPSPRIILPSATQFKIISKSAQCKNFLVCDSIATSIDYNFSLENQGDIEVSKGTYDACGAGELYPDCILK